MYLLRTIEEVISFRMRGARGDRTQAEMAEFLGIPFRTYQQIESGAIPRQETRKAISEKLGIPETMLFLDPDLTAPTEEQALEVIRSALAQKEPSAPHESAPERIKAALTDRTTRELILAAVESFERRAKKEKAK